MIKMRHVLLTVCLLTAAILIAAGCGGGLTDTPSGPEPAEESVIDGELNGNVFTLQAAILDARFEYWQRVNIEVRDGNTIGAQGTLVRGQGDHVGVTVPPGTHQIYMNAYDSAGQEISRGNGQAGVVTGGSVEVHIRMAQVTPVISMPQPAGLVPVGANFTATAFVAAKDGVPSCQFWLDGTQVDGSQKSHAPSFSVVGASTGVHSARLRATGTSGGVAEVVWNLTVGGGGGGLNLPPFASFTATPNSGPAPLLVNFNASGSSDSDGSIVSYAWTYGDGGTGSGVTSSHTYTTAGSYLALLVVRDDDGATAATVRQVVVTQPGGNQNPTASFTAMPNSGPAPLLVNFNAGASTDPDGSIVSYSWVFGDGGTGTGVAPSHTYTTAGAYNVMLTVTDDDGAVGTAVATITVTGGGGGDSIPPSVTITNPVNGDTVSGTVAFAATATDNVGVVGVQFKVDGGNLGPEDTTPPYSVPWDTTATNNGTHTLTATARDAAGNTGEQQITVTVQNGGGGGGILPQFFEWVGRVLSFWLDNDSIAFDKTVATASTPNNSTTATFYQFFLDDLNNLEVWGYVDLTTGALSGQGVGSYDNNGNYTPYPNGVWSCDPLVYDKLGDADPTTGAVTVPNAYIDVDGNGSAEFSGTRTLPQTDVQSYGAGLRSVIGSSSTNLDLSDPHDRWTMSQEIIRRHSR